MTYDVILPAGGTLPEDFASKVGTNRKALIQIHGQTVLKRTLLALKESGLCARIAVIGSSEVLNHPDAQIADLLLEETETGPGNILKGLDELGKSPEKTQRVMIVTCDLPFLTADSIREFERLSPKNKDISVPLIRAKSYEEQFPGTKATYATLKAESLTTGCLYIIESNALRAARPHIERVFENRKSIFGMAKLLGLVFVVKYITKALTVGDVEKKIESILGCSGAAVHGSPPELAFDIDYLEDYEYAVQHAVTHLTTA